MKILYSGCQWKELDIERDLHGKKEISYSRIFKIFKHWLRSGALEKIFENSVIELNNNGYLDFAVMHGDGTTTAAKRGGDCIGYNGHKKIKGEKIVAFSDRNCNVISPFTVAPGNRHESKLFASAFSSLKSVFNKIGKGVKNIIVSLDSAYDSFTNRKMIFNAGMIPNIKENPGNRKGKKRGRKRLYSAQTFLERFSTIERVFAWEDKFRKLLLRFERISFHHFGMKLLAYTMINLRHFC